MAVANFTLERFKTALKNGYNYTIVYNNKKYDVGRRYRLQSNFYYLDYETLNIKVYYTVEDLLDNTLIEGKKLSFIWDSIVIAEEFFSFELEKEIEIIKKFKKRVGE